MNPERGTSGESGGGGSKGARGTHGSGTGGHGGHGGAGGTGGTGEAGEVGPTGHRGERGERGKIGPHGDRRWALSLLAGLTILVVAGLLWLNQLSENHYARQGCERLDVVRTTLSVVLDNAANQIESSLKDPSRQAYKITPKIRRLSEAAIKDYRRRATSLDRSVRPYGTGHLAGIDCERAYPDPNPFGL